jgi:hypothetical protein
LYLGDQAISSLQKFIDLEILEKHHIRMYHFKMEQEFIRNKNLIMIKHLFHQNVLVCFILTPAH